jgi:nucleoside-diphosphate-sugar epimerase
MKITITGMSGFVGQNLSKYLEEHNHQIQSLSLRNSDWQTNFDPTTNTIIHLAGKAHDTKKLIDSAEYFKINTELTKNIFDLFLTTQVQDFFYFSSVKAAVDEVSKILTENDIPNPKTSYGQSKLLSEQYILSNEIPIGKRLFIIRPCMIHGPGNKGNLNILYKNVSMGFPWPLGSFENKRSFCSIENLCFIIKELIDNDQIPSGIYNIADDEPLSTNELIRLISKSIGKKTTIVKVNKSFIIALARIGTFLCLPFNSENLQKLTESYLVSNIKIKTALGKSLPVSSKEGLIRTFNSFSTNY